MDADRDLFLLGAANTQKTEGSNSSSGGSIGASISLGKESGLSIFANANKSKGNDSGNGTSWSETTLDSGNTLSLTSGRDTTLLGAQLSGDKVEADVGRNLTLQSQQDSDRYDSKQQSISGGVSAVIMGTGGGSANLSATQDKMHSNFDSVQEQTGIFAGKGGFDITVGDHTQLNGAVIGSTATADKNKLDTGTLGFSNIENKAEFKTEHQGGSISTGGSVADNFLGNMGNLVLVGANNDGNAQGTTHAAVSDGSITIRDQDKQQQNVDDLSRDVEHANNALTPIFDKEKEQNRLKEAQLIGEIGGQVFDVISTQGQIQATTAAKDALAKSGNLNPTQKEIEASPVYKEAMKDYGIGGTYQKIAQAATAALQGLAGGDMTKALAGASAPYLAQMIKDVAGEDNEAARIGAHAVLGAVLSHLQGNSAAAGGAGALSGELAAIYIKNSLYPNIETKDLTEAQKQVIVNLSSLAAGLSGGLVGDSTGSAVAGAQAGKNAVENNSVGNLGDVFGSQGAKYFEGSASLEKELLQDSNLTAQEKQTIRDQYIKGDLPEDVIKAILENNPGSDTVMALLNAKNPEDYALALLSTLPAERALALIGKMTKGAQATGVFNIADRVYAQLNDSRLGSLSGKLNATELQKLANNPAAVRVYDARSGHINVIQSVDGKLLRITVPNNEMKIISVGPIRPNQVKNLIEKGSFVPLP